MFVTVCSVIVQCGSKFLFVEEIKDEAKGKFGLPGGQLEPDESLEACALRELQEETGLIVGELQLSGVVHKSKTKLGNNVLKFVFYASATHEQLPTKAELECHWLTLDKVRQLQRQGKVRGADVTDLLESLSTKQLTYLTY